MPQSLEGNLTDGKGTITGQNTDALISTRSFCAIESRICKFDYFFYANRFVGGTTPRERRPADGDGLPHSNSVVKIKGLRSHHVQDTFAKVWRTRGVGGSGHN